MLKSTIALFTLLVWTLPSQAQSLEENRIALETTVFSSSLIAAALNCSTMPGSDISTQSFAPTLKRFNYFTHSFKVADEYISSKCGEKHALDTIKTTASDEISMIYLNSPQNFCFKVRSLIRDVNSAATVGEIDEIIERQFSTDTPMSERLMSSSALAGLKMNCGR